MQALTVLVLGFGPFLEVRENPSARLSYAVHGRRAGCVRIVGGTMPVSYERAPAMAVQHARRLGARAVLGIGVARSRLQPCLERTGWNTATLEDVDGHCPGVLEPGGPEQVCSTAPIEPLAQEIGAILSDDPGRYVCNAWLYRVVRQIGSTIPVAFLHIPMTGLEPELLVRGIARSWGQPGVLSPLVPEHVP